MRLTMKERKAVTERITRTEKPDPDREAAEAEKFFANIRGMLKK